MRGLDEIEDHPDLSAETKIRLLMALADAFRLGSGFDEILDNQEGIPEVSRRLGEWQRVASSAIGPRIDETMANMADRMAFWVKRQWMIETQQDLDLYVRDIAIPMLLLIDDVVGWGLGEQGDRSLSLRAGHAVQFRNMSRGRQGDLSRGVDFLPTTWTEDQLFAAAASGRSDTRAWIQQFSPGLAQDFLALMFDGSY